MGVTRSRHHLNYPFADSQDADVEGAAAKIEDEYGFVLQLVNAVREGCGCRLIDDPKDFEPGDPSGVLGRLALCVVEVRRHCDHRLGDFLTEVLASVVDELA